MTAQWAVARHVVLDGAVNVRDIGGDVYVVYAPAGRPAEINAPSGAGAVAIFDEGSRHWTKVAGVTRAGGLGLLKGVISTG